MSMSVEEQIQVLLNRIEQGFSEVKGELKQLKDANKPEWLSVNAFAFHTGLDKSTIARKCRLDQYKCKRDGGKWLIHRSELEA